MKAVMCERLGPPSDLVLRDLPAPVPGPGEVAVEVVACALNFLDTLIVEGRYQTKPDLPFSPGAEFAGTVIEVGQGVSGFSPGDRVAGYCGWGAAREAVAVAADRLVHVPEGLPLNAAAGLTVTYGTTLHALADRAKLRPGESLVVLGAAGGVGTAAIEIGKLMGARVIAVASSPEKLAFCAARGADETVDYTKVNLKVVLKALGAESGIDVVYDAVGGEHSQAALRALGWKGRFLVIGFAAGEIPKIPLNLMLLKGCNVLGVNWGRFVREEPEGHRAVMTQLLSWAGEGRLDVPVHAAYPLEQAAEAIGILKRREARGKVLLVP